MEETMEKYKRKKISGNKLMKEEKDKRKSWSNWRKVARLFELNVECTKEMAKCQPRLPSLYKFYFEMAKKCCFWDKLTF